MIKKLFASLLVGLAICSSVSFSQTTATWIGLETGGWANPANWDIGAVPNNSDTETFNVVIDLETGTPFTVSPGWNTTVDNVTVNSADATYRSDFNHRIENLLDIRQGELDLRSLTGATLRINAGEIRLNGNTLRVFNSAIERAVTSDFTLDGILRMEKGASVTGNVLVSGGSLDFFGEEGQGDATSVAGADIRLVNGAFGGSGNDVDVTFAADSLLRGSGSVGLLGPASNFFNEGTITANAAGQTLRINTGFFATTNPSEVPDLGGFTNRGVMRVANGATLDLFRPTSPSFYYGDFFNDVSGAILIEQDSEFNIARNWRNRGVIDVRSGGTLSIDSEFTTRDIRPVVVRRGSKVVVNTLWDNTGQAYNFGRRANEFEFDTATIRGGMITSLAQPLKISDSLRFEDTVVRGDIVLDQFASEAVVSNSRLIGDVAVSNQSIFASVGSNLSGVNTLTLDSSLSRFDAGVENEDVRWFENQSITGEGQVVANEAGQSFRNFGLIAATKENGVLHVASASTAGEIFLNMGEMAATSGGELILTFRDGKFFNGNVGSIIADSNSTVTINRTGDGVYANNGTIHLLDNSTLRFAGNYDTGFFTGINPAPTSRILLDGTMNLGIGEQLAPPSLFSMTNNSKVIGGLLNLDQMSGEVAGSFDGSGIASDLIVRQGASLTLEGDTAVLGKTVLDGGTASAVDSSTFLGDVELTGGAELTTSGNLAQRFLGNVTVTGANTVLNIEGYAGAAGKTFELVDGGEIHNHSVNFDLGEGSTLTGTGVVRNDDTFSTVSAFTNHGTINVRDGDHIQIIQTPTPFNSTSRFTNLGEILVTGSGVFSSEHVTNTNNGKIVLDGGSINVNQHVAIIGGEVTGNGSISAEALVLLDGDFAPGLDGIGQIDVAGTFFIGGSQSDVMNLLFEVDGTEQAAFDGFDFLSVDGSVILNANNSGTLVVDVDETLTMNDLANQDLSIIEITNGGLSGEFRNVPAGGMLASSDGRFQFEVHYGVNSLFGADRVVLSNFSLNSGGGFNGVPEPNAAMVILLVSALGLGRRRRV